MKKTAPRPFVLVNIAMTADGKIAPASRHFDSFGGPRDRKLLLELRASADAVMSGARTVDLDKINLGPGGERYRKLRVKRGLSEYNLRVIVSGRGSIDPSAEIFKHTFSPLIILAAQNAPKPKLERLQKLATVKTCGRTELDFAAALRWLRAEWKVKRLLCEGGGEVNAALFKAGLVDELHLTICPLILGGRDAPTLADGEGIEVLTKAARLKLVSMRRDGDNLFTVYRRNGAR